ncbi:MAG TPA: TIR domain-containing protein [Sphingomicrobium sp.]|nr:TIR domain-containing protein [Sphingomicrobium sp.]
MSDVFISYKAEDRKRIQPLVQALQADGYSVWWDEHIGTGDEWRQTIEKQLDSAKCVIVAWSKRSAGPEGRFVRDEASRAQRRDVYVPVLLDAVDPPLGFGESQAASLRGWHGNRSDPRYQHVASAVRRIAGSGTEEPARSLQPPGVSRRAAIAGGAAATVAVAGVGGWALLKPSSADASSNSIAVLPFANLSGDPAQAYFSDGIAEELRSALARLAGLRVVGRTSSEAVRDEDAETAAKKLGVVNILTGSVRKSPAVVRVGAQLIDGRNGLERWSESYDRAPGDAIKIQTDIAENVAQALSVALGGSGGATLTIGGTNNAEAHNLVLQADEAMDRATKEDSDRAIQLVSDALQLDPNYADAYSRKAVYLIRRSNAYSSGREELARYRAAAAPLARKALALAPKSARAHMAMGTIYQNDFNIGAAWSEYRLGRQLAPGDAAVLSRYSYFVSRLGDQAESLRTADKVLDLEPLDPDSYGNRVGALLDARRYQEAVDFAEETQRKSPDLFHDPLLLGHCLMMAGKLDEAKKQFELAGPDKWERLTGEALIFVRTGDSAGLQRKLQRMQELFGEAASYQYAEIYAQAGDKERALSAIEAAWAVRDAGLISILVDPLLDPIRNEPRFEAIVKRMNFPT